MPHTSAALLFAIGYKDGQPSVAFKTITTGETSDANLILMPITPDSLARAIAQYDTYGIDRNNEMGADVKYMEQFYLERQRQKQLEKESRFFRNLQRIAFPCCKLSETYE